MALVGDFDAGIVAHQAIGKCFALAQASESVPVEGVWLGTESIIPGDAAVLESFQGVWCVPGSPYRNTDGALWAIQYARTRRVPFLGTCGGLQHALLEYSRNFLGLKNAAHTELEPGTNLPLLHRMQCTLIEKSQKIVVVGGDQFRRLYGADAGLEGFHCSFGLNPRFEYLFKDGPLEIVARSEDGEARAIEMRGHPFFIGTLFQPERRALAGGLHPLVEGFFSACASITLAPA